MKKVCVMFPYPMGEDFLSGGVSKLIVANIEAIKDNYSVFLIAPKDNIGLVKFMEEKYPSVKIKLVDFLPLARFVDTKNVLLRYCGVFKRVAQSLLTNKNVKAAICEVDPDIVHFHGEVTYPYLKYGMAVGAGTVFHTSCFRFSKPEFLRKIVVSNSFKNANLVISPTKSIANLFGSLTEKNVVVPNPIITVDGRLQKEPAKLEESFTSFTGLKIIFVGRICVVKQLHFMLHAIAELSDKERENIKFFVIGKPNLGYDFTYFEELKQYIADENIESNVEFLGYKNNVDDYLKLADVGVLISESEAISMAGIEYLHNSLPIIGFNNPGINETVLDGIDGFLVENGDVEGLADSIRKLFDIELLNKMKDAAYAECERNFSMNAFKCRILSLYREIER